MSIIESFKKTIVFFDDLKKEGLIKDYALIGGLALSAWIRPRTTQDIDLAVTVSENIKWSDLVAIVETRLQKRVALHKGTRRTNIKEKFSFISGNIEVDVISSGGFRLADEAIKKAVAADIFGMNIKVVTPEYLILLKLLPLSSQDIVDIESLAKKADMSKVASLAEKYYLMPKLESVISKK